MKRKNSKRLGLPKSPPPIHTMGTILPRNEFTRLLVNQHVVATQECDHERTELLARFILDLGNIYCDKQVEKTSYLKMALDQLYDLDDKIGTEFHSTQVRLFQSITHGYILAELTEIRALINAAINCKEKASRT